MHNKHLLLFYVILISVKCRQCYEINIDFNQTDYDVEVERLELVHYDKNFVKHHLIRTFKYNRTCTAFNLTFSCLLEDLKDIEVVVQAYKFASNEYRLFPPIRFEYNLCDALSKNSFGIQGLYKCGNFSGCNIQKGKTYHICNWTINQSKFPPLIPTGRYMWEFQYLYLCQEIVVTRFYMGIVHPII